MFRHVVHCDWSIRAAGRWMAEARRAAGGGWHASGPRPVPEPTALVDHLSTLAAEAPTLAAFDFPIGFPAGFGARTGFDGFRHVLDALARGEWSELFAVAATPGEVGPRRPFYPAKPGGTRLLHLLDGHGVGGIDALMRACERAGPDGGSAGCMFWTMGAKQVGKAALFGWRTVILPARRRGARIWPFDGDLGTLAERGGLTLAESYPGDAYGQLGLSLRGRSKRRLSDREACADPLMAWAAARGVTLDRGLTLALRSGFPAGTGGDDGFDAVVGLLAAIAVATMERPEGAPVTEAVRRWEGWILGKRGVG